MKRNNTLLILLVTAFVCIGLNASAQKLHCNTFLKGNYVECGINWNGAFGSSVAPPAGYHNDTLTRMYNGDTCLGPLANSPSLGFVADPDHNGWTVGTPNYFGDFILPSGHPQEGWSYMADGVQIDNWSHNAQLADTLEGGMTGGNISYTDTLGVRTATWSGIMGAVHFTQIASLDSADMSIKVQVYIDNTTLTTISDIYYMRTINPHNDRLQGGQYATFNRIDYQIPDTVNRTVVSARGLSNNNAYVSLGTQSGAAKAFICKHSALPNMVTLDAIYLGDTNFMYNFHDTLTANTAIGLVFNLASLGAGASAYMEYYYLFHPSAVDSVLSVPISSTSVASAPVVSYKVYPNPAGDQFRVSGLIETNNIEIFDVVGHSKQDFVTRTSTNSFNVSPLAKGTYFIVVKNAQGVILGRLPFVKL